MVPEQKTSGVLQHYLGDIPKFHIAAANSHAILVGANG